MNLCTVYDGCSTEKEETLLQNYLQTYLNSISFFCNTSYEIRVHHFCRKLVMHLTKSLTHSSFIIVACGGRFQS